MAQPNVLEAMLLVAEENFISEQNLVKLHLDQKPPLPGQARDTWNGLFVEFQTKVSAAQAVYLQAKEAVEQQRLGIQAKTVKPTKLPSPDGGPKFSHGLKTTAKNVTDFMALFEHHVSRQNFPKTENGRNRWVDALPSYFAEPKATLEDLDFMRTHAEANTQWPNFKVEFANRYVKDHTTLEAASLLDKCKQQGRAIDVFATERVQEAIRGSQLSIRCGGSQLEYGHGARVQTLPREAGHRTGTRDVGNFKPEFICGGKQVRRHAASIGVEMSGSVV